jgi:hypothetical protein
VYPLAGFRVDADTLDELTRRSGDCAPREPAPAIPGRSQCRLASQETRRPHRCAGDFDISGMSICNRHNARRRRLTPPAPERR